MHNVILAHNEIELEVTRWKWTELTIHVRKGKLTITQYFLHNILEKKSTTTSQEEERR